jgi:hypothetical protein
MSEPNRITAHTKITEHATQAVDLLMIALRDKPRVAAIANAFGVQAQAIEDALFDVLSITLDNAVGDALNQAGALVGAPRGVLDDTDYRAVVRATIRARRSSGTGPDVIAVMKPALGATPFVFTAGGATVCVELTDVSPVDPQVLADLVEIAVAAGFGYCVVAPAGLLTDAFTFSTSPLVALPDAALGFGDDAFPGSGGALAGAYV